MNESQIQSAIFELLHRHPKVGWASRMNVGKANLKGKMVTFAFKGCSDIIGQMIDGRFLAIEVKQPKGIVTDEQEKFINQVNELGGVAGVARSVDDAKNIVER